MLSIMLASMLFDAVSNDGLPDATIHESSCSFVIFLFAHSFIKIVCRLCSIGFFSSTIWKAAAFTKCIGIFYKGMTPKNIANGCIGEVGTAEIDIHEYNGTKSNRVKKYIFKDTSTPNKPIDISDSDELPF